MEKSEDRQTAMNKLQNKLAFEEKSHSENETTDCRGRDNLIEIGNLVTIEDKEKDIQVNTLRE